MPPVAKTRMPARWARTIVAATVVAAVRPAATAAARSRRLALSTPRRPGQSLQLRVGQADGRPAVQDGDGRRHGPGGADRRLRRPGRLQVDRPRQAVGDQRRFQGHDRDAVADGVGDGGADVEADVAGMDRFQGCHSGPRAAACQSTISRAGPIMQHNDRTCPDTGRRLATCAAADPAPWFPSQYAQDTRHPTATLWTSRSTSCGSPG